MVRWISLNVFHRQRPTDNVTRPSVQEAGGGGAAAGFLPEKRRRRGSSKIFPAKKGRGGGLTMKDSSKASAIPVLTSREDYCQYPPPTPQGRRRRLGNGLQAPRVMYAFIIWFVHFGMGNGWLQAEMLYGKEAGLVLISALDCRVWTDHSYLMTSPQSPPPPPRPDISIVGLLVCCANF